MATVKQHIENAVETIEKGISDIKDIFESLKAKYQAAMDAAKQPTPTPVEDADAEFATIDQALSDFGALSSNLRGAVSALDQTGAGSTQVGGSTTSAAGGAGSAGTTPVGGTTPAGTGSQETGPTGAQGPSSQTQQAAPQTAAPTTAEATPTDTGSGVTSTGVLVSDNQ